MDSVLYRTPNTADCILIIHAFFEFVNEMEVENTGLFLRGVILYALSFCKNANSSFSKFNPYRLSGTSIAERRMEAVTKSVASRMESVSDFPLASAPVNAEANISPAPQKNPSTFSLAYFRMPLSSA